MSVLSEGSKLSNVIMIQVNIFQKGPNCQKDAGFKVTMISYFYHMLDILEEFRALNRGRNPTHCHYSSDGSKLPKGLRIQVDILQKGTNC